MSTAIDLDRILGDLAPMCESRAEAHDDDDSFVTENYEALRERRVFSALVPAGYGGGGATHAQMCDFLRRLAHACPATALALAMHQHLVGTAAAHDAAGRPGRVLLQKVAKGELVLVTSGANDWLELKGAAVPARGGYRVSAVKPFASGSPMGDIFVTSAVLDAGDAGPEVLHFTVPLRADGVELLGDWKAMGMRGTGSQTIRLSEVFVPDEAVMMRRPRGPFPPAFAVMLTVALPLVLSAYLGTAEKAAARALELAGSRAEDDPVTQILAGELENNLVTARLAVADMIRLATGYDIKPTEMLARDVLVRKTLAANAVIATAEKAVELVGGRGYLRKTGLERLLRDVHAAQFHPLPARRQQLFAGRLALGLDPVTGRAVDRDRRAA